MYLHRSVSITGCPYIYTENGLSVKHFPYSENLPQALRQNMSISSHVKKTALKTSEKSLNQMLYPSRVNQEEFWVWPLSSSLSCSDIKLFLVSLEEKNIKSRLIGPS